MSDPDFVVEPWRIQIPVATVPKPAAPQAVTVPPDIIKALDERTDSLIIERKLLKKGFVVTTTPKLNGLQDAFKAFTARVEAAAESLTTRMDTAAETTETAIVKFGAAVGQVEATAKQIDDAANQLTNGGPAGPLPNGT